MNSHLIYKNLFELYINFGYKLKNTYVFPWESDFFCISTSGYTYEIEVKVSKSDFNADFKKKLSFKGQPLKHDYILDASRIIRPNKFFFACPEGLISLADIPPQYGLIWVKENGCAYYVRDSKFIHKQKLFENHHFTKQLMNKYYYRYLDLSRELELRQNDIKFNQKRLYEQGYF